MADLSTYSLSSIRQGRLPYTLVFLFLVLIYSPNCFAQSKKKTNELPLIELDNLVQGRLYVPTYNIIRGSQFFNNSWKLGNVLLMDRTYHDLPLLYDLYADEIILIKKSIDEFQSIQLVKQYINSFSLGHRNFVNIRLSPYSQLSLDDGFYEIILEDQISLICKRSIEVDLKESIRFFERNDKWILIKDNVASELKNKKSLFKRMSKTDQKDMNKFIKSNRIRVNKAGEEEWLLIIQYFNKLESS